VIGFRQPYEEDEESQRKLAIALAEAQKTAGGSQEIPWRNIVLASLGIVLLFGYFWIMRGPVGDASPTLEVSKGKDYRPDATTIIDSNLQTNPPSAALTEPPKKSRVPTGRLDFYYIYC
jgi:hypothetical protein